MSIDAWERSRRTWDRMALRYDGDMRRLEPLLFGRHARAEVCRHAGGALLEVAIGTGLNLPHYPPGIRLTGVDLSPVMLAVSGKRAADLGLTVELREAAAERLPFADASFDTVSVAFGLRNMTHKDIALAEMCRVLRPGGKLLVLEFSKVARPLEKAYDWYSFRVLPRLGRLVAGDADSYRYLIESIRRFPPMGEFEGMIRKAGFARTRVEPIMGGLVAIHSGWKV